MRFVVFVKVVQIVLIAVLSVWNIYALKVGMNACVPQPYQDYYMRHTLPLNAYLAAVRAGEVMHRVCQ